MAAMSESSSAINRVADDQSTGTYMGHEMSETSSVMMRIDNVQSSDPSSVFQKPVDDDENEDEILILNNDE